MFGNGNALGTVFLTLTAPDTVRSFAAGEGQCVVEVLHLPVLRGGLGIFVIEREVAGNRDLPGTVGGAVGTAGAGNGGSGALDPADLL